MPIECKLSIESKTTRIYLDRRTTRDFVCEELINAIAGLADERISHGVRAAVGRSSDIDGDGKLAIVVTAHLGGIDSLYPGVMGLTCCSDFVPAVTRPNGNESDVIFLSDTLSPGKQLEAVLAHEWAHAAVFARRFQDRENPSEIPPSEDDWLNEAIAHVIESRVSGTTTNLTQRLDDFVSHPQDSPLIIRDYFQSKFWRHHGSRGAAYSFLTWCLSQSEDELLTKLIDARDVGMEKIEHTTQKPFDILFLEWTTSIGQALARRESVKHPPPEETDSVTQDMKLRRLPDPIEWSPTSEFSSELRLRLKGTAALYIKVNLPPRDPNWELTATATNGCRMQLTAMTLNSRHD